MTRTKQTHDRRFRFGDVAGNVNLDVTGDFVAGHKIVYQSPPVAKKLIERSPYPGLEAFRGDSRTLFFGRESLCEHLRLQLKTHSLLVVLGASGTGKSSLVLAGLLPTLSERCFVMLPDQNPYESLRSSLHQHGFRQPATSNISADDWKQVSLHLKTLKKPDERWLFFVDQFEEIFTRTTEPACQRFISTLVDLSEIDGFSVIVGVREEFREECSVLTRHGHAQVVHVPPLEPNGLRQAIELPAREHGVEFEPGLVDLILQQIPNQPGALPLLQYTLQLLWEQEEAKGGLRERVLRQSTYDQLGGVGFALQKAADAVYEDFEPQQRTVARRILLRLVEIVSLHAPDLRTGNSLTSFSLRRRVPIGDFTAEEERVLEVLEQRRLLVTGRASDSEATTVQAAHEALFTSWPRLRDWISDTEKTIVIRNWLTDGARRYEAPNAAEKEDELLTGSRLIEALDCSESGRFDDIGGLRKSEVNFLRRSEAEQRQRERTRSKQRLWLTTGVAGILVVTLLVYVGYRRQQMHEDRTRNRVVAKSFASLTSVLAELDANAECRPYAKPSTIPPLLMATIDNRADCIAWMLKSGASVDVTDSDGNTALMLAAELGSKQAVEELLRYRPDITKLNKRRDSALHAAASSGSVAVAELLLAAGAHRGAVNARGQTARDIAVASGDKRLAEILKED